MAKLITGGTGFVGAELAHILVDRGEEVVLFDKAPNLRRIDDISGKVKVIQGDLSGWSEVCNVVKNHKISAIYHLGSMTGVISEYNPWGSLQTNVIGTYNVLEAACLFDVEKVMFTSSVATYLLEAGEEVTDTTIQRPVSIYGVGKLCAEGLGRYYNAKFGLDFRAIRYPGIMGPGVRIPGLWFGPMVENAIRGNPYECTVAEDSGGPLIFFKDAARAADIVLQAPKEDIKMMIYNVVGSVSPITPKDVEQSIKRQIPDAHITYKTALDAHIQSYMSQISKKFSKIRLWDDSYAQKEWGWKPAYPTVDDMVSAFINEMKAHPDRYDFT